MTSLALAWTLTYAAHSLLLAALAGFGVVLGARAGLTPASRVVLLRIGLFAPLITACIAVSNPLGSAAVLDGVRAVEGSGVIALFRGSAPATATPAPPRLATAPPLESPGQSAGERPAVPVRAVLLALVGVAALLGGARQMRRERRARRVLGSRWAIDGLARLVPGLADRGVRVSICPGIASPMALSPAEVVLPEGLLERLSAEEREALFAHELAHLARRDPLWLGAARWLVALTWVHPLHALLLRRLEEETELAADAQAVAATGRPLALARCLERACVWQRAAIQPAIAAGMGASGNSLVRRIEALCGMPEHALAPRPRRVAAVSLIGVGVLACAGPAVTTTNPAISGAISGASSGEPTAGAPGVGTWGPYGPFLRTAYTGPDAEPGEQRFWLTLNENGGLARLPEERIVSSATVLDVLRTGMRRGSIPTVMGPTEFEVLQDRVVVEIPADVPFVHVLAWFQNFARDGVRAYKTEVALAPASDADVLSVFLPTSSAVVPLEEEEPEEELEEEAPGDRSAPRMSARRASMRIGAPGGTCTFLFEGDVEIRSEWAVGEFPREILSSSGPLTVIVEPQVPAGIVLPLLRKLQAERVDFVFQGVFTEPPLGDAPAREGR